MNLTKEQIEAWRSEMQQGKLPSSKLYQQADAICDAAEAYRRGLEPAANGTLLRKCPGMGACSRTECVSRCAIHGPAYVEAVKRPIMDALVEPCKGCGKRPIDFAEDVAPAPPVAADRENKEKTK